MKTFGEKCRPLKYKGNYSFRIINNEVRLTNDLYSDESKTKFHNQPSFFQSYLHEDTSLLGFPSINEYFPVENQVVQSKILGQTKENPQENQIFEGKDVKKRGKMIKLNPRLTKIKKTSYNIGRWTEDEHRRFIEAILKYGNEWKSVQKHIKSRSSTQSRSHSQKFFLKIKNYSLFDFKNKKPCISSLNEQAKTMTEKEKSNMIDLLISYEYNDSNNDVLSMTHQSKHGENQQKIQKKRYILNENDDFFHLQYVNEGDFMSMNNIKNTLSTENTTISSYKSRTHMSYTSIVDKEKEKEKEKDEFKVEFLNVFSNHKRRNSFEDNIYLIYADSIYIDRKSSQTIKENKSRKRSLSFSKYIKIDEETEKNEGSYVEYDGILII